MTVKKIDGSGGVNLLLTKISEKGDGYAREMYRENKIR